MTFDRLFEPVFIRETMTLPNRLVMAPMTTTAGASDGSFSDQEISYLAARARGGIGTIISPACFVHKSGHSFARQVGADSDAMVPSLARCADAINKAGGISILQIHHGGNAARTEFSGQPPLAPSAVMNRRGTSEKPQAMSIAQIEEIIEAFARAAGRAKRAGFSGIEVHGANTYLLQQFFSSFTNKRDDDYGAQSLINRSRFAAQTIKAIRSEVGSDYPIFYRISPEEPEPDGYTTADAIAFLQRIVPLGIDVVHVSSWEYGQSLYPFSTPGEHPTIAIKKALHVPVIGVGQITTPQRALDVIHDGIDAVALGRVLLFDQEWGNKAESGRAAEIKTEILNIAEIEDLFIPDQMKRYLRKFYS